MTTIAPQARQESLTEQPALPPPAQAHAQAQAHELAQAQELCAQLEREEPLERVELPEERDVVIGMCTTWTRIKAFGSVP